MPIYEYRCAKCGDFEVMQKITEKALRKCPTCKGKVVKLLSNTAFQLKGTGWYVTDYAGKSKTGSGESKSEGTSSEPSKSSDSAPAAASEGNKSEGSKKAKSGDKGSAPSSSPVT